jgi:hypothetical protein
MKDYRTGEKVRTAEGAQGDRTMPTSWSFLPTTSPYIKERLYEMDDKIVYNLGKGYQYKGGVLSITKWGDGCFYLTEGSDVACKSEYLSDCHLFLSGLLSNYKKGVRLC